MSNRCSVDCGIADPRERPQLPEGMDFSNLDGLCDVVEGDLTFESEKMVQWLEKQKKIWVIEGSCDVSKWDKDKLACTETLAICSETPCSGGSSATAPVIYYNIDRIKQWVRKHAINNVAFILKQCFEKHNYEVNKLGSHFLSDLIMNIYLSTEETALAYLQAHERAHCVGNIKDEGEATAIGLYEAFRKYIFDEEQARRRVIYKPQTIESLLASYLTILRIAYHKYQIPGYNGFVKHVELPLAIPKCYGPHKVVIEYMGSQRRFHITITDQRGLLIWGNPPLNYKGKIPSQSLSPGDCGLYEIWGPCDRTTVMGPHYPTP
jgi:hypothetical protein